MKTLFLLLVGLLVSFGGYADVKSYVRDYAYRAEEYDTKYTCRIYAIDGVKKALLEELGTYVRSVIKIEEDARGNRYLTHDLVTLTAGILNTEILKEKWDRITYYVKARMEADPDDVLRAVEALQEDHRLEEALRESMDGLRQARATIERLQREMAKVKDELELAKINREYVRVAQDLEAEYKFQHALRLKVEGRYDELFAILSELAEKGNARAQARLGHLYERGMGRDQDYVKAAEWYLKSIANGGVSAYARLGFIYERGLGVRRDIKRAIELYRKAAELGNHHGQSYLGRLYLKGIGVEKDTEKALQLLRQSVSKVEHGRGLALLGFMYQKGIEVEQDYAMAADYYRRAADRGNGLGMARMAWIYVKGIGVRPNYEKAWDWVRRAVDYNNPYGLAVMGYLYERGLGVDRDRGQAFEIYQQAAAQGSAFAMFRLGKMYEKGKYVDKDEDEAVFWYRRAAERGHRKSRRRLEDLTGEF